MDVHLKPIAVTVAGFPDAQGDTREVHFARYVRFRGTKPGECLALEAIGPTAARHRFHATMLATTFLANGAEQLLKIADEEIVPKGTFLHQNVLHPHVAARRTMDEWQGLRTGEGIKDEDIACRRGFYIDLDPLRPRDTSATAAEQHAAFELADHVVTTLFGLLGDEASQRAW
jgi:hypothetical protein